MTTLRSKLLLGNLKQTWKKISDRKENKKKKENKQKNHTFCGCELPLPGGRDGTGGTEDPKFMFFIFVR